VEAIDWVGDQLYIIHLYFMNTTMDGTTPITTATTTVTTDTTPTTGTPAEGVDGLNAGNHVIRIENNVNVENGEKDVGKLAVWTVSSAKPGNGMCGCVC
jgi:hypothetical protein